MTLAAPPAMAMAPGIGAHGPHHLSTYDHHRMLPPYLSRHLPFSQISHPPHSYNDQPNPGYGYDMHHAPGRGEPNDGREYARQSRSANEYRSSTDMSVSTYAGTLDSAPDTYQYQVTAAPAQEHLSSHSSMINSFPQQHHLNDPLPHMISQGTQQSHLHHHHLPYQRRSNPDITGDYPSSPEEHGAPSVVGQPGMPEPARRPKGPKLKFTPEDDALLIELKEAKNLTWKQIADFFPGRSSGTLQVRYCTKLKPKTAAWGDDAVAELRSAIDEYEDDRWRAIAAKVGHGMTPAECREKARNLGVDRYYAGQGTTAPSTTRSLDQ